MARCRSDLVTKDKYIRKDEKKEKKKEQKRKIKKFKKVDKLKPDTTKKDQKEAIAARLGIVAAGKRVTVCFLVDDEGDGIFDWFHGSVIRVHDVVVRGAKTSYVPVDIDFEDGASRKGFKFYFDLYKEECEAGWSLR